MTLVIVEAKKVYTVSIKMGVNDNSDLRCCIGGRINHRLNNDKPRQDTIWTICIIHSKLYSSQWPLTSCISTISYMITWPAFQW